MTGTMQSNIAITLRNPLELADTLTYTITPTDTALATAWVSALKEILTNQNSLEKNYCFLGFPHTARTLTYLCNQLNDAIMQINKYNSKWVAQGLAPYIIEEYFCTDTIRFAADYPICTVIQTDAIVDDTLASLGLSLKHKIMNRLHNHFERLQGIVGTMSDYYLKADAETKYAIRQLNILCHEIESLVLSQRKASHSPEWVRASQITTFLHAPRYTLKDEYKQGFVDNSYNREFGTAYMHWAQIGKTLIEVFRDEHAPKLTDTICEAINALEYYSGEFDVEWGNSVTMSDEFPWHVQEQSRFKQWLQDNNLDPEDPELSLGHLPVGTVDLESSFSTADPIKIREILSKYLDIYKIEIDGVSCIYDYCWSDVNYKEMQIQKLIPGYNSAV